MNTRLVLIALVMVTLASQASNAQHPSMPPGMTHEEHLAQVRKDAEMKQRGNQAMGFDQDKTTHHFVLTATGGLIQVEVNDPTDLTSRDLIRTHLREISSEFGNGVFDKPFETHAEVPPGVPTMQRLKASITYSFETTATGGLVRIVTANPDALHAVHDFLRYQIKEHATGESPQQLSRLPGFWGGRPDVEELRYQGPKVASRFVVP